MNINLNLASIIKGEIINPQNSQTSDLLKLLSGDVFSGKILNIINNQVQINVGDGQIINARLGESMNFNIGDNIIFQVKDNNGKQITIKPMQLRDQSLEIVGKALESADLQPTERNIQIVKALIDNQMPIDKQSINNIISQLNQYKGVDIDSLVLLNKYEIPVNQESINGFFDYSTGNHKLSQAVENIATQIPETVNKYVQSGDIKTAFNIVSSFCEEYNITPELKEVINKIINNQSIPPHDLDVLKEMLNTGKLNLKNINNDNILKEILISKEFGNVLKDSINERWTIDPTRFIQENISKPQEIKNFYRELYEDVDRLIKTMSEGSTKQNENVVNNLSNLKSNINFMNSLNHVIPYIQIPIKMQNENGHGDLYVYNNTSGRQINEGDEVTAFLHLDLEHLGATDVDIRMKGKEVSTNFTLSNDESMKIVEKYLPELKEKLEKRGYKADYSVEVSGEKSTSNSVIENIKGKTLPNLTVKRYTFDVRA